MRCTGHRPLELLRGSGRDRRSVWLPASENTQSRSSQSADTIDMHVYRQVQNCSLRCRVLGIPCQQQGRGSTGPHLRQLIPKEAPEHPTLGSLQGRRASPRPVPDPAEACSLTWCRSFVTTSVSPTKKVAAHHISIALHENTVRQDQVSQNLGKMFFSP